MHRDWLRVSAEEDIRFPTEGSYEKFSSILKGVREPSLGPESFPRVRSDEPISSYGVIAVWETDDSFEYYATQARGTIEFLEIVRCGPRKDRLYEYLSAMTEDERRLLATTPFETLWDDLLLEQRDYFPQVKDRTSKVFRAYEEALPKLIDLTTSHTVERPWCFPKGRKQPGDRTNLQAALREMKEEGGIEFSSIVLVWPKPISVTHRGTDGQLYTTTYFAVRAEERYAPRLTPLPGNVIGEFCLSQDMATCDWISFPKDGARHRTRLPDRLEDALMSLHRNIVR